MTHSGHRALVAAAAAAAAATPSPGCGAACAREGTGKRRGRTGRTREKREEGGAAEVLGGRKRQGASRGGSYDGFD